MPGVIDSDTIRLRIDETIAIDCFLVFAFRYAPFVRAQLEVTKTGAILSGLNSTVIASLIFAVPPRAEQALICAFLDEDTGATDSLTAEAEHTIELLQERRTALISAAVTGKIDVRDRVAQEAA